MQVDIADVELQTADHLDAEVQARLVSQLFGLVFLRLVLTRWQFGNDLFEVANLQVLVVTVVLQDIGQGLGHLFGAGHGIEVATL